MCGDCVCVGRGRGVNDSPETNAFVLVENLLSIIRVSSQKILNELEILASGMY